MTSVSRIVLVLIVFWYSSAQGWQHDGANAVAEGSTCSLKTGGNGVCTRIDKCEAVINREITYANLNRCFFIQSTEVICCPKPKKPSLDFDPIETTTSRAQSISVGNVIIDDKRKLWGQGSLRGRPLIVPIDFGTVTTSSNTTTSTTTPSTTTTTTSTTTTSTTTPSTTTTTSTTTPRTTTTTTTEPFETDFIWVFNTTPKSPVTTPTAKAVATRTEDKRPSVEACEKYKAENPAAIVYHILDGKEASPGDFPYIGGMLYRSERAGTLYDLNCGCSLISETFALTAAHCVPEWPALVRFGAVDWNPLDNFTYRYDAQIKNIILHEDYVSSSYYNDIALIEFTEPVQISGLVAPVCLHTSMSDIDSSTILEVAGWGVTDIFKRSTSQILLSTNITTVPLNECNTTHIQYGVSRKYSRGLIDSQYCAFDREFKKDSCSGDSGGPLAVTVGNSTELVGIVSFGNACGSIVPSVYTRVAYFLDWIEQRVWPTPAGA